jgi:hypothetical protein
MVRHGFVIVDYSDDLTDLSDEDSDEEEYCNFFKEERSQICMCIELGKSYISKLLEVRKQS